MFSYDYQSIMHYPSTAFSKNGRITIEPKDKNVKPEDLGQRHGFSQIDLIQLNKAFRVEHFNGIKKFFF